MPSISHEALLLLFRNRPELAPELLRDALGVALPSYASVVVESAELTEVVPTAYQADLVLLLVDGKPVFGIVVEAQLHQDPAKRFTWPLYAITLRARLRCATCVLALTVNERIAAWARLPIDLGGGNTFAPLVLGPSAVPIVTDVETARADPELVVLSAMAHGNDDPVTAMRIATAAHSACLGLDQERALLYLDLVGLSLSDIARSAFEVLMTRGEYEFQSPFFKSRIDAGREQGRAEGHARGKAESIVTVLAARGIALSAEQNARIVACTDLAILDRWLERSVTVASAEELFTE